MIKLFHVIAIGALISSATYAYSVKYDTLLHGEQLAKLKLRAQKEREAIAVLKAEWQFLNRPDRLQMLAERHLNTQPLAATQLVRFSDIPAKGPKVDDIGQKLEALGIRLDGMPTASLPPRPQNAAATPRPSAPKAPVARPAATAPVSPRVTAAPPARPAIAAPVTPRPIPARAIAPQNAPAPVARPVPPRSVPLAAAPAGNAPVRLQ